MPLRVILLKEIRLKEILLKGIPVQECKCGANLSMHIYRAPYGLVGRTYAFLHGPLWIGRQNLCIFTRPPMDWKAESMHIYTVP